MHRIQTGWFNAQATGEVAQEVRLCLTVKIYGHQGRRIDRVHHVIRCIISQSLRIEPGHHLRVDEIDLCLIRLANDPENFLLFCLVNVAVRFCRLDHCTQKKPGALFSIRGRLNRSGQHVLQVSATAAGYRTAKCLQKAAETGTTRGTARAAGELAKQISEISAPGFAAPGQLAE